MPRVARCEKLSLERDCYPKESRHTVIRFKKKSKNPMSCISCETRIDIVRSPEQIRAREKRVLVVVVSSEEIVLFTPLWQLLSTKRMKDLPFLTF